MVEILIYEKLPRREVSSRNRIDLILEINFNWLDLYLWKKIILNYIASPSFFLHLHIYLNISLHLNIYSSTFISLTSSSPSLSLSIVWAISFKGKESTLPISLLQHNRYVLLFFPDQPAYFLSVSTTDWNIYRTT